MNSAFLCDLDEIMSFLTVSLLSKFTVKTLKLYYHFVYYKPVSVRFIINIFRAPSIYATVRKNK